MIRKTVIFALLILFGGAGENLWAGPKAGPVSFGACVADKKALGGAFAACAEDSCNWEVCVDNIMWNQSSGQLASAPFGTEDKGARDSAIATCMPKQQIMEACLKRHAAAPAKPGKEAPPEPKMCKKGNESDAPFLRYTIDKLQKELKGYAKLRKKWADQTKEHRAAAEHAGNIVLPYAREVGQRKAAAQAGGSDSPAWASYKGMVSSPRHQQMQNLYNAYKEQQRLEKEAYDEWKVWDKKYQALKGYLEPAGLAANAGDCETAVRLLKQPKPAY